MIKYAFCFCFLWRGNGVGDWSMYRSYLRHRYNNSWTENWELPLFKTVGRVFKTSFDPVRNSGLSQYHNHAHDVPLLHYVWDQRSHFSSSNSPWPPFFGCHSKQREHCIVDVVIVESMRPPFSPGNSWNPFFIVLNKLSPTNKSKQVNQRTWADPENSREFYLQACFLGHAIEISAIEEFPRKQLHGNNRENELEENKDYQDVEYISKGAHNTCEHGLKKAKQNVLAESPELALLA